MKRLLLLIMFLMLPFAAADGMYVTEVRASQGINHITINSVDVPIDSIDLSLSEAGSLFNISTISYVSVNESEDELMKNFTLADYEVYRFVDISVGADPGIINRTMVNFRVPKEYFQAQVPQKLSLLRIFGYSYERVPLTFTGQNIIERSYTYSAELKMSGTYALAMPKQKEGASRFRSQVVLFNETFSDSSSLDRFEKEGKWRYENIPQFKAMSYKLEAWSTFEEGDLLPQNNTFNYTYAAKNRTMYFALVGNSSWSDYTVSADVMLIEGTHRKVVFYYTDRQNYYYADLSNDGTLVLGRVFEGEEQEIASAYYPSATLLWYTLKVTDSGGHITVSVNDEQVIEAKDFLFKAGKTGFLADGGRYGVDYIIYDNLLVYGYNLCKQDCCPKGMQPCFDTEECVTPGSVRVGYKYGCMFECIYGYGQDGTCSDAVVPLFFADKTSISPGNDAELKLYLTNGLNQSFHVEGNVSAGTGFSVKTASCNAKECSFAADVLPSGNVTTSFAVSCDENVNGTATASFSYLMDNQTVIVSKEVQLSCTKQAPAPAAVKEKGFFENIWDFLKRLVSP